MDNIKGGPGSGNFDHEGRPGEVGGSAPGGGGGYGKEKKESLILSGSERAEAADAGHFFHGTGAEYDKFEIQSGEHLSQIYLSDPSARTSSPTQAEQYAENHGRLLEVSVDWNNVTEFSPKNDPIAQELRAEYFANKYDPSPSYLIPYPEMQPFIDFVESKYPGRYNAYRVDEFHSESYAFTDPSVLTIVKEYTIGKETKSAYPALKSAADWCMKHSIQIPDDITAELFRFGIDVKTPGYYARVMWQAVRELYAGDIEAYDFEEVMLRLISEQLRKAWNDGMRELNLDPEEDQTEEGEAYLQEIMTSELDYVGPLAEEIIAAAEKKESIEQFRTRVDLWVGRYEDTKNEAILFYSEKNQRLRWVYGDTQHCGTCQALNGIVAFASEWETAGVQPQSPPNDLLECGGWHCQCTLEPTDDRRSPDALTRIMDAITAGNL